MGGLSSWRYPGRHSLGTERILRETRCWEFSFQFMWFSIGKLVIVIHVQIFLLPSRKQDAPVTSALGEKILSNASIRLIGTQRKGEQHERCLEIQPVSALKCP